jgi:precorrin-6B methylase 2
MSRVTQKVLRLACMSARIAFHAVKSFRLVWRRYVARQPVVGSIPHELGLHERYWERRFAADTRGWEPVTLIDGMLYEATPYLLLLEIMRQLELGSNDVFVDLGCGKGRALTMAAQCNAGLVVGVEQSAGLLDIARRNLSNSGISDQRVKIVQGLAQEFDFDDTTVIFMFNPFGAKTLQEVVDCLHLSLRRKPRRLRIVYANPVHEKVLLATRWLENTSTWPAAAFPEHSFQPLNPRMVSFWQTRS